MLAAAVREASEELGVAIDPADLEPLTVMHRTQLNGNPIEERVDFFFACRRWSGEPRIVEPEKCGGLEWYDVDALPDPIVPHETVVIRPSPGRAPYRRTADAWYDWLRGYRFPPSRSDLPRADTVRASPVVKVLERRCVHQFFGLVDQRTRPAIARSSGLGAGVGRVSTLPKPAVLSVAGDLRVTVAVANLDTDLGGPSVPTVLRAVAGAAGVPATGLGRLAERHRHNDRKRRLPDRLALRSPAGRVNLNWCLGGSPRCRAVKPVPGRQDHSLQSGPHGPGDRRRRGLLPRWHVSGGWIPRSPSANPRLPDDRRRSPQQGQTADPRPGRRAGSNVSRGLNVTVTNTTAGRYSGLPSERRRSRRTSTGPAADVPTWSRSVGDNTGLDLQAGPAAHGSSSTSRATTSAGLHPARHLRRPAAAASWTRAGPAADPVGVFR